MGNRQTAPDEKGALMEACRDFVLRRRSASGHSPDTDDIAQDACVRALTIEQPERVRDPLRYVMRIARNLFLDRQRRRQREARLFDASTSAKETEGVALDPERIVAGRQELDIALAAIEQLPPRCREAFTLHRFHAMSYAAIARQMGVGTGTVEKHIAEAMLRVARALRETEEGPRP